MAASLCRKTLWFTGEFVKTLFAPQRMIKMLDIFILCEVIPVFVANSDCGKNFVAFARSSRQTWSSATQTITSGKRQVLFLRTKVYFCVPHSHKGRQGSQTRRDDADQQ